MKGIKSSKILVALISLCMLVINGEAALGQHRTKAKYGIAFIDNSWNDALNKAKAAHKYIFVDAYATWCAPCKQLKATTFSDARVAEYFNRNFVNLSLDVEKGDGVAFGSKWDLQSYPTLYFFDSDGNLINRYEGFITSLDLLALAQKLNQQKK
ncbi:thioredoxin family protein [Mucilaginibacter daejeonensis]|uniref:thioredoxin family protein n=1 Tax=Mucilaginibacter daejeonensis TaxID=398049 RepID=UPI001D173E25|nr:thioredoxin fold domain-containing protein [Mucilaginibacter daejeonensis]UEG54871.1 thioredoxin family protein [Mucilaginibacter daejeonensis]